MQLTPFGKAIRGHRIQKEITLAEMAKQLDVSSAFASAIETGAKSLPTDYAARAAKAVKLDKSETAALIKAAEVSAKEIRIPFGRSVDVADREMATMFARRFSNLTPEHKASLRRILEDPGVE